jgi:hypothetical protein
MKVTSFKSKFLSVCLLFVSLLCLSGSMSEYGAPFTKSSHHWSTKRTSHSTSHCGGGVRLLGGASHRHDRDTRRHWMTSGPPAHHLVWKWVSSLSSAIWRQKNPPVSSNSDFRHRDVGARLDVPEEWSSVNKSNWVCVENPVHSLKYLFLTRTPTPFSPDTSVECRREARRVLDY